ncbi:MAG: OsmC family protein [Saprospiraceae bacterium]|nr:OsmC family protein [Saprospiraceae bacterium]
MTSKVIYNGELRTECVHLKSGQTIMTDAPLDNNGKGEAFSPTDLTATSLGTCMVTLMGIAARNHDIDIDGTQLEVTKHMAADPRRISAIDVRILMPDRIYDKKEQKLLETAARTCPVAYSLHPDIEQNLDFVWKK